MVACKKCKKSIGMFQTKVECNDSDCTSVYCEACAISEMETCPSCEEKVCKKCMATHAGPCKDELETPEEEDETCDDCGELVDECTCDEEEEVEGITFNKAKTVCILDMSNYDVTNFIEELETLRNDFVYDEHFSTDDHQVYFKKSK